MLTQVKLKNFQCHTDLALNFDPGVNVIAGQSDKGKSSIIRAIRWVVENRPSGTAFCKKGTKEDTAAHLFFSDGAIVMRERGSSNRYLVRKNESDSTTTLQALRSDVPTEVSTITNMAACSIQSQHDPYYLLQDSPGEAAKKLNSIADLSTIGEVITAANAHVAKRKREEGDQVALEQALQNEIAVTNNIVAVISTVAETETLLTQLENAQNATQTLRETLTRLQTQKRLLAAFTGLPSAYRHMQAATAALQVVQSHRKEITTLTAAMANIRDIRNTIAVCNEIAALAPHVAAAQQVFSDCTELRSAVVRARDLRKRNETWQSKHQVAMNALIYFKKKHPTCPLCGKPWDGDTCKK